MLTLGIPWSTCDLKGRKWIEGFSPFWRQEQQGSNVDYSSSWLNLGARPRFHAYALQSTTLVCCARVF
ncbi:hypothetical protein VTO42DRAFT_5165 [Malbranchea cinnamomea]